jgi:hypothetical protein
MTMISISLSDERMVQLQTLARQAGLSAEEFLRRHVELILDRPDEHFQNAAAYLLVKNAELYRRLA